ncbi:MAG: PSD1 and planctomycete cytochrome C domain-containing protein [Planctomycetota bacterium]
MNLRFFWFRVSLLAVLVGPASAMAEEGAGASGPVTDEGRTSDESEVLFVRRIAPLLREKCLGCHGQDPETIEGGIDFRGLQSLVTGGDSGQAGVVPGHPNQSSIYLAAARGEEEFSAMPPKEAEALDPKQLRDLHHWIKTGAKWPSPKRTQEIQAQYAEAWSAEDGVIVPTSGGLDRAWTERRYDPEGLWAYQPLREFEQSRGIDHWINAAMPGELSPAPRADRPTLLRRATFDLTGLPPSEAQIQRFLSDAADDKTAMAALVDRLLESPHYGERMAQHWLDVTRYADSSGFANDYDRGNAWRYRDYVVRAFNDDKPYDQFVREQIAGDEILGDAPEGKIAVGFLRMGPWELTGMEVAKVARMRFLDDATNAVGETFLGQSLQCCRCHDHKFDPIPTGDYYSIQAVFATTQLADRNAAFLESENVAGFDEKQYLLKRKAEYQRTLKQLDDVLLENAQAWYREHDGDIDAWNDAVAAARKRGSNRGVFNAARSALMRRQMDQASFPPKNFGFTPAQYGLERVARKGLERLRWQLDRYQPFALSVYNGHTRNMKSITSPQRLPKDRTQGELEESFIHTGGDPFAEGQAVQPDVLSVVQPHVATEIPKTLDGRRAALAHWIADPKNPLTPRVMVNRVWQWHFGRAIAGNPNNFGSTGKRPTHPELLDELATQFIRDGCSIKQLHREIMNSDAYCRSTNHPEPEQLSQSDPQNESYAAFLPRRLSAEELRDAMLHASGELNPALGGIPCRPIINAEVALQPRQVMGTFAAAWTPNPTPRQRNRRSIYVLKLRGLVDPSLEVFNAPSPDFSCERRDTSTVTPQVFAMFNSNNTRSRGLALAKTAIETCDHDQQAIEFLYRRLFARSPTTKEVTRCLDHLKTIQAMLPESAAPDEVFPREIRREAVEENTGERFTFTETLYAIDDFQADTRASDLSRKARALAELCLVLMNSNEFVYVY